MRYQLGFHVDGKAKVLLSNCVPNLATSLVCHQLSCGETQACQIEDLAFHIKRINVRYLIQERVEISFNRGRHVPLDFSQVRLRYEESQQNVVLQGRSGFDLGPLTQLLAPVKYFRQCQLPDGFVYSGQIWLEEDGKVFELVHVVTCIFFPMCL